MRQTEDVHVINNGSGTRLALTRTPNEAPSKESLQRQSLGPVLLAHGTFSNNRSVRGLAQHLSDAGFECWTLDFQGHGQSEKPKTAPSFDSMCIEDAAAALDYLREAYPSEPIVWVGHSAGGLAVLTLLCRKPEYQELLKAIVTLASQTTHAAQTGKHRIIIQISNVITRLLGFAPGKLFKLGPENEFGTVMTQWYRWSLTKQWRGDDGFNYIEALSSITVPTLMLSGSGDKFIAPTQGCLALFDQLGCSVKRYQECGIETGFSENYNHSRLVSSRAASREIWPFIKKWLTEL